ncbi:hypothetical protein [Natrinema gelatinilyticum]|uniref:hypothetical protein n=1 Tax=Natrinema gelatinilyticum TaxID=2961571 RepID=UPI0020C40A0A|nr:hypothetical protein [Natrinema gelatinilyticum]
MTEDGRESTRSTRGRSSPRWLVTVAGRLLTDLVIVGGWTVLITLLTLSSNWSRVQFYGLLFIGIGCYVLVTAPWVPRAGSD